MNQFSPANHFGVLTEPATLTIQRLLPGPIERVWAYLTDSNLRKQWLAAGDMTLLLGAPFELVWRNDELSNPPGQRPEGFPVEHRLHSEITEIQAPHTLGITWGNTGGVTFTLETQGDKVLLTIVHRRLPDRGTTLNVSAGWHMHLNVLAAVMQEQVVTSFWNGWVALKQEYAQRIPE